MNKALTALTNKLSGQQHEIVLQLKSVEGNFNQVNQQLKHNQEQLINALKLPALILPEQEISRLNFIIRQQQIQEELEHEKSLLILQEKSLLERLKRIKTELKMIEKYQNKMDRASLKDSLKKEQNLQDELQLLKKSNQ